MTGSPKPDIEYTITARPAHRKEGDDAWKPKELVRFNAPDHAESAVVRTSDVIQRHIKDLDDDDLIVVTRENGTDLFPEPQHASEFRRHK